MISPGIWSGLAASPREVGLFQFFWREKKVRPYHESVVGRDVCAGYVLAAAFRCRPAEKVAEMVVAAGKDAPHTVFLESLLTVVRNCVSRGAAGGGVASVA
jgi:hypothetical protein